MSTHRSIAHTLRHLLLLLLVGLCAGETAQANTIGPQSIAIGITHACALTDSGGVKCWGSGPNGQLGNDSTNSTATPLLVKGITTAVALAAGKHHTCALLANNTVRCWGWNVYGVLGTAIVLNGASSDPVEIPLTGVYEIAAGRHHNCARLFDDSLRCWGHNNYGQLGNGSTTDSAVPVEVSGIISARLIAAGSEHSCARLSGGTVRCWGANDYGQLGNGSHIDSSVPVEVAGLPFAMSVTVGADSTCARISDNTARCWGSNSYGQLGDGTNFGSPTPVTVSGLTGVTGMSSGVDFACATLNTGGARCWGTNGHGQLGDGSLTDRPTAVSVSGLFNSAAIVAGYDTTCARGSDQSITCWGNNRQGQLGIGSIGLERSATALEVYGLATATTVDSGGQHVCATLNDQTARCWGSNQYGQMGDGSTTDRSAPVTVSGLSTVQAVATGRSHACARLGDGSVRCWGRNGEGALGNGTNIDNSTPVAATGLFSISGIATGAYHSCAVRTDGRVFCWGRNSSYQIGDGSWQNRLTPVQVPGITTATQVVAGEEHTCALLADRTVLCWGYNSMGQVGNDTVSIAYTPIAVSGINDVIWITTGDFHTCAMRANRDLYCWGANGYGQVSGVEHMPSNTVMTPLLVAGIPETALVDAGADHTCMLAYVNNYPAYCWGKNQLGQTAAGNFNTYAPIHLVQGMDGAVPAWIVAGYDQSCVRVFGGAVRCFGSNQNGQLGIGHLAYEVLPQSVLGSPFHTWPVTSSASGNGSIAPVAQTVDHGAAATFTVIAGAHHHVGSTSGSGCTVSPLGGDAWQVASVQSACSISVSFAIDQYALDYYATAGGHIDGPAHQMVDYGQNGLPVTAVPDTGYQFVQWSDGRTDNPRSDSLVASALAVTAQFTNATVDLQVAVSNGRDSVQTGDTLSYDITLANTGIDAVSGASIHGAIPPQLGPATWTCLPAFSTAPCPTGPNGSGSGDFDLVVNLNGGTHLRYALTATVYGSVGEHVWFQVTATAPAGVADGDLSNNTASDWDPIVNVAIFANGFE